MTSLLLKIFVKDHKNTAAPSVRSACGSLAGVVGIIVNLLLFTGKFTIGSLSGSIAITADAFNNLSDAGSSVISIISLRISSKPADRDHPFGHARIEYIASMLVSFLILFIGISLLIDSFKKIFLGGEPTDPSIAAIAVLVISVLGKLWLYFFNRRIGKLIDSSVIMASAADCLSDALGTFAVLVATLIYRFSGVELDAYMGVIVAVLILRAGYGILKDALNAILGTPPNAETVERVREIIFSHPEALGIHDLLIHNYGPGRTFVCCHVEVDGGKNIYESHDAVDNMEKELMEKLGVCGIIHLDPVAVGDPLTDSLRAQVTEILSGMDRGMSLHDFRIVPGTTHTNLIFDAVVPFEVKLSDGEIEKRISDEIRAIDENYFAVITVERQ